MKSPNEEIRQINARNRKSTFTWVKTLSLTIRAYLQSFSCCCLTNLRNPAKFSKNSSLHSSRSSIWNQSKNAYASCNFLL